MNAFGEALAAKMVEKGIAGGVPELVERMREYPECPENVDVALVEAAMNARTVQEMPDELYPGFFQAIGGALSLSREEVVEDLVLPLFRLSPRSKERGEA